MAEARAQHSNLDLDHALAEAERRFIDGNAASLAAFSHACEGMPGGTTRNVLYYPPFPLNIVRGEGARVWDADGHAYTDWLGDMSAGLFGHSNPEIRAAAEEAQEVGLGGRAHAAEEHKLAEQGHPEENRRARDQEAVEQLRRAAEAVEDARVEE
mgnify:CR=1 FL=1